MILYIFFLPLLLELLIAHLLPLHQFTPTFNNLHFFMCTILERTQKNSLLIALIDLLKKTVSVNHERNQWIRVLSWRNKSVEFLNILFANIDWLFLWKAVQCNVKILMCFVSTCCLRKTRLLCCWLVYFYQNK